MKWLKNTDLHMISCPGCCFEALDGISKAASARQLLGHEIVLGGGIAQVIAGRWHCSLKSMGINGNQWL